MRAPKVRQRILVGLLLLVIGIWAYFEVTTRPAPLPTAGPAPDIGVRAANGVVRLSDLKGKVVLLDFWATWCGPCRMSIPTVEALYEKKHAQGFEVLGLAMENDGGAHVPAAIETMHMTYPAGLPTSLDEARPYDPSSIPLTVLVDKRGMVRFRQAGYAPGTENALAELVDMLLKE